jgi:hypothetical protein
LYYSLNDYYPNGMPIYQSYPCSQPVYPYQPYTYYQRLKNPISIHFTHETSQRPFPEVNPTKLHDSAVAFQALMKEANVILTKLEDSESFAIQLMEAAQQSNHDEVDRLIQSTGVNKNVKTTFNPDGVKMELISQSNDLECCRLLMSLRW